MEAPEKQAWRGMKDMVHHHLLCSPEDITGYQFCQKMQKRGFSDSPLAIRCMAKRCATLVLENGQSSPTESPGKPGERYTPICRRWHLTMPWGRLLATGKEIVSNS